MKHHVHPETYDENDPLEWRAGALHTDREICEMTWCTYEDHTPEAKAKLEQQARDLKKELKKETTR